MHRFYAIFKNKINVVVEQTPQVKQFEKAQRESQPDSPHRESQVNKKRKVKDR